MHDALIKFVTYAELIAFVFTAVLLVVGTLVKILDLRRQERRSQDYRIYAAHSRWTRTEVIALVGLLVAVLGLGIAILRD